MSFGFFVQALLSLLIFSGCALVAATGVSTEDVNSQDCCPPQGFTESVRYITSMDELFDAFIENEIAHNRPVPDDPYGLEYLLILISQNHSPRSAYLKDFDYLITALDSKFGIYDKLSREISDARNIIEDFFHINDMIFFEFLWDGFFPELIELGHIISAGYIPDVLAWYFGEFNDAQLVHQNLLDAGVQYDILLPETNMGIILHF
jgi:hypothetical protein